MTSALAALTAALADRYRIERELGGGGMSRVFLATEVALGRDVVIKVLTEDLSNGVSAERFAREIAMAARLQQANIVPGHRPRTRRYLSAHRNGATRRGTGAHQRHPGLGH